MLSGESATTYAGRIEAFRQGLRELGYVEGRTITIEYRYADGKPDLLPALAADLVRLRVDVIVTAGDLPIRAAKEATSMIPIVVAVSGELAEPGYVASLARPGGNITGLVTQSGDMTGKHLELIRAVLPKVSRVAILLNPDNRANVHSFNTAEALAGSFGIQLLSLEVRTADEIDIAFQKAVRNRAEALIVLADVVLLAHRQRIAQLAAKSRLPALYQSQDYIGVGGLMFYGADLHELFRRSATYVDKIVKGAKPGDLPIQQPTKFELVVNLKTAKALGISIPKSVLLRADRVIE